MPIILTASMVVALRSRAPREVEESVGLKQRRARACVRATPAINFKRLVPCIVLAFACLSVEVAHAKAHCFCKLGPVGSPFHDFGQIATFNTQIGRDKVCRDACNNKGADYMAVPANQAAVCAAAMGGNVVTYSAVGTGPYSAGNSITCPSSAGGLPGKIVFGTPPPLGVFGVFIAVNNIKVDLLNPSQTLQVPIKGNFTSFELHEDLALHNQQWTYDAILYRDGVKVEALAKKSPLFFVGHVYVQFTDQPNSFVHGHTWKVEYHYAGRPRSQNGSATFHIP